MTVLLALALLSQKAPDPGCALQDNIFTAWNLPAGHELCIGYDLHPMCGFTTDGDLTLELPQSPDTVYLFERGHGPSLVKMPPGLGDYHVICVATA